MNLPSEDMVDDQEMYSDDFGDVNLSLEKINEMISSHERTVALRSKKDLLFFLRGSNLPCSTQHVFMSALI